MKIKDQEKIRLIELALSLSGSILGSLNVIDSETKQLLMTPYLIDMLTCFRTLTLTSEYKELQVLYNEVIKNTSKFMKDVEMKDPVSIFALYVYMYRSGYLSYNNHFEFNNNTLDLTKMLGIDVVKGSGLCKSIASMLSDIYNNSGFTSSTLYVNTSSEVIDNMPQLTTAKINVNYKESKLADALEILIKYTKISNHVVTIASDKEKGYVLDPTNDGILFSKGFNKLVAPNNKNVYMRNDMLPYFYYGILGFTDINKDIFKMLKLESIDIEEYKKLYLEALKFCRENTSLFKEFSNNNMGLYEDIHNLSKEQNGYVKRLFPFIKDK